MKTWRHIGWFYLFYFVIFPLRAFLMYGEWSELYDGFNGFHSSWLEVTTLMSFYAYALAIDWLLKRYHSSGDAKKWFLLLPIVVLGPIAFRYFLQEYLSPILVGFGNYHEPVTAAYYIKDNLYYAIIFILFGISYFYVHYAHEQQKKQFELSSANRKMHLDHLRSQMNGHFLFNTLNGLYALFQLNDNRAGPYLEKLNNLFEYSLYEPNRSVPIHREVEKVKNFIDLQSLRTTHESHFKLNNHVSPGATIPQFLLFPLVENAFKHGDLTVSDDPAVLEIYESDNMLIVKSQNLIAERNKDAVGGIGLSNLRERLNILYQGKSKMGLTKNNRYFKVELEIPVES